MRQGLGQEESERRKRPAWRKRKTRDAVGVVEVEVAVVVGAEGADLATTREAGVGFGVVVAASEVVRRKASAVVAAAPEAVRRKASAVVGGVGVVGQVSVPAMAAAG